MRSILIISFFMTSLLAFSQEIEVNLSVEIAKGKCGAASSCEQNIWCFDLYATPSVDGALLKSYEIWFQIIDNSPFNQSSGLAYYSDQSCKLVDQNDLPAIGATSYIRVAADEALPNATNILRGKTKIHNFCVQSSNVSMTGNILLIAGGQIGIIGSNMSLQLNGRAVDGLMMADTIDLIALNPCKGSTKGPNLVINAEREERSAQIRWQHPLNLSGENFVIEHSSRGGAFRQIGEISTKTDHEQTYDYSFNHAKVENGVNYYRIKTYIGDEELTSNIVPLHFDDFESYAIAPNPSSHNIRLGWDMEVAIDRVRLIDNLGQVVYERRLSRDSDRLNVDISSLPSGIYRSQFIKDDKIMKEKEFAKVD